MSVKRGNLFPPLHSDGSFRVGKGATKVGYPDPQHPSLGEKSDLSDGPLEVGSWPVHFSNSLSFQSALRVYVLDRSSQCKHGNQGLGLVGGHSCPALLVARWVNQHNPEFSIRKPIRPET